MSQSQSFAPLVDDALSRGDLPAAEQFLRQWIGASPGDVRPMLRLGTLYTDQSRHGLALEMFNRALATEPGNPDALCMLGMTYSDLGDFPRAATFLEQALQAQPLAPELHFNLGLARFETGDFRAASSSFGRCYALRRGEPWGRESVARLRDAPIPTDEHDLVINEVKVRHDCEQLDYLLRQGRLPAEFAPVAAEYHALHAQISKSADASALDTFDPARFPLVARTYKRPLHIADTMPAGPLLNPKLDVARLEAEYFGVQPNVVVVDDFLAPPALAALREFCRGSTIWNNPQAEYLGAYFYDGFHSELLLRLAAELRERLPRVMRGHPLQMLWGYKYASRLKGIGVHADTAAVNVNFWITEDEANEDRERGGLLIYPHDAPPEWGFAKFNADPETVMRYLNSIGSEPIRVPYRANRAVIFDSDLFHATDSLRFREGYLNRRINVTFLYGLRRPPQAGV